MNQPLVIRKQVIREAELNQIRKLINDNWHLGRSYISRELCRLWDWRQDNGKLKEQVCRILLRQLEDKELIELPPRLREGVLSRNKQNYKPELQVPFFNKREIRGKLGELPKITFKLARHNSEEKLWNYLVHKYHYKSFHIIVGAHIKTIAYAEDVPIACLAWSSSVFRIRPRDEYIGWDKKVRDQNIRHVVNNSRFLILPWIQVKNLASHILSLAAKQISSYWESIYNYPVYLLETFVDRSLFRGTCYQAANWQYIGQTKGHAKKNGQFYHHGNIKDVYVYPLRSDCKDLLKKGGSS